MKYINSKAVKLSVLCFLVGINAQSQAAPVLPDVQPNIPRPENLRPEVLPSLPEEKPSETTKVKKSPIRIIVGEYRFDGNKQFTNAQLAALLKDFTGHEIGMHELNEAMALVRNFYKSHGYMLAQIFLPPQDLKKVGDAQATVEFKILEGTLSQVIVEAGSGVDSTIMQGIAQYGLNKGDVLNERNLVRNLMVLNGLPGVTASSQLNPGAEVGSSDAVIAVEPKPEAVGFVRANTFGNRYTGREVASFGVAFNNPSGAGDQLLIQGKTSANAMQRSLGVSYLRPVNDAGTLMNIGYNYVDYRLGKEFDALNADGDAQYFNASFEHPLIRDTKFGLSLRFGGNYKILDDNVGAFSINNRRDISSADFGLSGDWINDQGNTVYQWSAILTPGRVSFKDSDAELFYQTNRRFFKWAINTTRTQYFENGINWILRLDYQGANHNLDIAERFGVGAINRWRGFAELPSQADEGWMSSNELKKTFIINNPSPTKWLSAIAPYTFYDFGEGRLSHNPISNNNHIKSTQAGMGFDLQYVNQWTLSMTYSKQKREAEGSVTESEYRVWGQLGKSF